MVRAKAEPTSKGKRLAQAERWPELARPQNSWRIQKRPHQQSMHSGPRATQPRQQASFHRLESIQRLKIECGPFKFVIGTEYLLLLLRIMMVTECRRACSISTKPNRNPPRMSAIGGIAENICSC